MTSRSLVVVAVLGGRLMLPAALLPLAGAMALRTAEDAKVVQDEMA